MKNYQIYGWSDKHTFETMIVMAHSIKEARQAAIEFGIYAIKIRPIRIHPGRPSQLA